MEFLIFWAIFGAICYLIAERNGRDTRWAIIWGLLFGIFAVIGYLIAGKPRKE